jgi:hypothetical protein
MNKSYRESKTPSFGWIRSVLDPDPTAFYDKRCIKSSTARTAARPQPRGRHLPRALPRGRSLGASALSQQPPSGCLHRAAPRTPCVTVIFLPSWSPF